ncbi:MAG: DnaJ domain-containing protein [Leptospiraceae bacterium]|nr:DnaJ domain-containing protein [Leptospiraceae bacterium]
MLGGSLYLLGLWMFISSTTIFLTILSIIISLQGLSILIQSFETLRGEKIYDTLRRNQEYRDNIPRNLYSEIETFTLELRYLFEYRSAVETLAAILACICIHIAKADGKISEKEIKTIKNSIDENFYFNIDHKFISKVVTLTKDHINSIGINKLFFSSERVMFLYLELIQSQAPQKRNELITLLFTIIYEVAISDHGYASPEKEYLFNALCEKFGMSLEKQEVIKRTAKYKYNMRNNTYSNSNNFQTNKISEARKLFGLEQNFNKTDLDKSWKKIAMMYHPDKFHSEGEEVYNAMNKKFLEAKNAYDILSDYLKSRS